MAQVALVALPALFLARQDVLPAAENREPTFLLAWGKKGDQPSEFYSPFGRAG